MSSAAAKQPDDEPDKGWLVLLASLLFIVVVVCAVRYARALACPWPVSPPEIAMLVCTGGPT